MGFGNWEWGKRGVKSCDATVASLCVWALSPWDLISLIQGVNGGEMVRKLKRSFENLFVGARFFFEKKNSGERKIICLHRLTGYQSKISESPVDRCNVSLPETA